MGKATTEIMPVSVESSNVEEEDDEIMKESISNEVHDEEESRNTSASSDADEKERDINVGMDKESRDHLGEEGEGEGNFVIVPNNAVPDTSTMLD